MIFLGQNLKHVSHDIYFLELSICFINNSSEYLFFGVIISHYIKTILQRKPIMKEIQIVGIYISNNVNIPHQFCWQIFCMLCRPGNAEDFQNHVFEQP